MKLLSKSQVASDNANLKKKQIDEGVALARRVDDLRRLLSELELSKKAFIENQVKELEAATSHIYKKKESLEVLISSLEEKREELRKPLDKEWEEVKDERFIISQKNKELDIRDTEVTDREVQVAEKEESVNRKEDRINTLLNETEQNAEKSREDREVAARLLQEAITEKEETDKKVQAQLADLEVVKQKTRFDAQANEQVAKANKLKEEELKLKEKQINDRYQTLLRAEKRNGQR